MNVCREGSTPSPQDLLGRVPSRARQAPPRPHILGRMTSSPDEMSLRLVRSEDGGYIDDWAEELERGRWPGWITDGNLKLRYATQELKTFMSRSLGREIDDEAAGVGQGIFDALTNEAWTATISGDSLARLMPRVMGYLKDEFGNEPDGGSRFVPEPFMPFYEAAPEAGSFGLITERFDYTVPGLPSLPVEFLLMGMRDRDGKRLGVICVSQMGVRPTLVSLLARGDERMFERMANLQEPTRCQGAILFADLQGSSRLSRILPTSTYFSFIRSLATSADAAIASNGGVVGRHAGDGVSGFFLMSDGGNASEVAASVISAAQLIRTSASNAIAQLVRDADLDPADYGMNMGLHWGASLYMGQLVPGGRLDVTALGDSVNECARIQEAARGGAVLASKQLVEQLVAPDAERVGVRLDKLVYRTVSELEGASAKAIQDAGLIPVSNLA